MVVGNSALLHHEAEALFFKALFFMKNRLSRHLCFAIIGGVKIKGKADKYITG